MVRHRRDARRTPAQMPAADGAAVRAPLAAEVQQRQLADSTGHQWGRPARADRRCRPGRRLVLRARRPARPQLGPSGPSVGPRPRLAAARGARGGGAQVQQQRRTPLLSHGMMPVRAQRMMQPNAAAAAAAQAARLQHLLWAPAALCDDGAHRGCRRHCGLRRCRAQLVQVQVQRATVHRQRPLAQHWPMGLV